MYISVADVVNFYLLIKNILLTWYNLILPGLFLAFYGWGGGGGGAIWPAIILCNIYAEPLTLMEPNLIQMIIDHSAINISMNDVIMTSSFFIITS